MIKGSSQCRNDETKLKTGDLAIVFMPMTRLMELEEKNLVKMVKSHMPWPSHLQYKTRKLIAKICL